MPSTQASRRAVYRTIAQREYSSWPAYATTPFYDRRSLGGLAEDINVVASIWFDYEAHESANMFVIHYPLDYVEFGPHDCYLRSNQYKMPGLFRLFLLKELHGWDHETALVEYLDHHPQLCEQLGLKTIPDQSTLWRSWHKRFTADLRETVETAARTILTKAQNAGISVLRQPERKHRHYDDGPEEADPDDQAILKQAKKISGHVSRLVFPAFSLDRSEGCEIHENAYWDLQTYLGLRENLAANESARSFIHESTRDRTPLGHSHREHIRHLSIPEIREMYRQAVNRLLDEVAKTDEFFRAGIIAIDITENDPFTGDRAGHEAEIIGTKEATDEYAYQWATVQLVGNAVPIVLEASLRVRQSLGDRERLQVHQTVHGGDDVEEFRAAVLLLRGSLNRCAPRRGSGRARANTSSTRKTVSVAAVRGVRFCPRHVVPPRIFCHKLR